MKPISFSLICINETSEIEPPMENARGGSGQPRDDGAALAFVSQAGLTLVAAVDRRGSGGYSGTPLRITALVRVERMRMAFTSRYCGE